MDKVEFGIKLEQIEKLKAQKDYVKAAEIADTIEWRKVKKWSELLIGVEVYEKAGKDKEARNVCVYAYNRNLGGRSLVYKLTELSIRLNDLDEADDLYNEFVEMAPHDMSRYVLLYKLNKARGVSNERLISILEEYKENELDEHYEYELAVLYAKEGRIEECIKECDDLFLWFNDGEYVEKALELKQEHTELTPSQKEKLGIMKEFRQAGLVYEPSLMKYNSEEEADKKTLEAENAEMSEINPDDISVPEKDYTIYDTQNIQEQLAKSMAGIFEEIEKENEEEYNVVAPVMDKEEAEPVSEEEEETDTEPVPEEEEETETEPVPEEEEDETDGYETLLDDEMAATTEPINVEVIEIQVADNEEVDEPTREILINTHRWNQVKCVMEEIPKEESEDVLKPDDSKVKEEDQAPEEDEDPEKIQEPETKTEESERPLPEISVMEDKIPVQMELELEEEKEPPVEGQIDLLYYLDHMDDPVEEETEDEQEKSLIENIESDDKKDNFDKIIKDAVDSGALKKEDEELEKAIDELTKQLMEEVASDLAADKEEPVQAAVEEEVEAETATETNSGDTDKYIDELGDNAKKYVKKYLFMNGMESSIIHLINGKKKENPDGTSQHGNIIIVGKNDTDKTGFAINLFKAMHADDEQRELKIAKTTAEVLNRKGVISSTAKIKGTTLIIENADRLRKDILNDLNTFMETDTGSMLVIFTGEEYLLKKAFGANPSLRKKFDYVLELKHYSVNELVDIAKEYAKVKGYSIDEGALSALYITFDDITGDDEGSEIEKVKRIVDAAIIRNGKSSRNFFGKKRSGLIMLKEKHFSK